MVKPTSTNGLGIEATLDDCALTLRDVLQQYKADLQNAYLRSGMAHDAFYRVNHSGVELMISRRLVVQFLAEEALEK